MFQADIFFDIIGSGDDEAAGEADFGSNRVWRYAFA
jgi:hypothetical protein